MFFHIDEDAPKLTRYFDAISVLLTTHQDKMRLLKIEMRVSELLNEKQKRQTRCGIERCRRSDTVMGQPEDYIIEDEILTINKPTITIRLEEDQEIVSIKIKNAGWW
jgi:hypothetical protein